MSRSEGSNPSVWSRRGFLAATSGAVAALAACSAGGSDSDSLEDMINNPPSGVTASGFPIATEPLTLSFMTGRPPGTMDDWNAVASWKKYEDLSGVHIDWGPVPVASVEERRNLALASGDYPEAMWGPRISTLDIGKYGEQGIFVGWRSLIEKYMPNLSALMDTFPEIAAGMVFPDGEIYGMPGIQHPDFLALRYKYKLWVRADWLDELGLSMPTSTAEYADYLRAVKAERPGDLDVVIPYGDSYGASGIVNSLTGSFGVANRGMTVKNLDVDPDTHELRFYVTTDGYRALLAYLAGLYAEGLIAEDVFSKDAARFSSEARDGVYGSLVTSSPAGAYGGAGERYTAMPALTGPTGERSWNYVFSSVIGIGQFLLTDHTRHPVATARWLDHFYGEEGSKLFFMGVEGESYRTAPDGSVEYLPAITEAEGKTLDAALKPYVTYMGGGYPGVVREAYFQGTETVPQGGESAKKMAAGDVLSEVLPEFTFTAEEGARLASLATDIETYVAESRDRFIAGDLSVDADWEDYRKNLDQMGLSQYMEIQSAAFERIVGR